MEKELSLEFLRVVERAAIASAHTMGLGDRHKSDHMAVEAMRSEMDTVHMDGTIVIGEGERDEAPMLFIGEKVGAAAKDKSRKYPEVVIAVDPLEFSVLFVGHVGPSRRQLVQLDVVRFVNDLSAYDIPGCIEVFGDRGLAISHH